MPTRVFFAWTYARAPFASMLVRADIPYRRIPSALRRIARIMSGDSLRHADDVRIWPFPCDEDTDPDNAWRTQFPHRPHAEIDANGAIRVFAPTALVAPITIPVRRRRRR